MQIFQEHPTFFAGVIYRRAFVRPLPNFRKISRRVGIDFPGKRRKYASRFGLRGRRSSDLHRKWVTNAAGATSGHDPGLTYRHLYLLLASYVISHFKDIDTVSTGNICPRLRAIIWRVASQILYHTSHEYTIIHIRKRGKLRGEKWKMKKKLCESLNRLWLLSKTVFRTMRTWAGIDEIINQIFVNFTIFYLKKKVSCFYLLKIYYLASPTYVSYLTSENYWWILLRFKFQTYKKI